MKHNKQIKVVAFDFFDTLVTREVNPETTIAEWSRELQTAFTINESVDKIYLLRKGIERSIKKSGVQELKYQELIKGIFNHLHNEKKINFDVEFEQFYQISTLIEFNIELNYTKLINDRVDLARRYKNDGKKVIIISDSYLPRSYYQFYLNKSNIADIFDDVYISSEVNARKSSGDIYDIVIKKMGVSPNELLMIGDNDISDCSVPKSKGIMVSPVTKDYEKDFYNKKEICKYISDATRRNFKSQPFNGYISGILLFIERLYKSAIKDGCRDLLFLAREGENLKYLFDLYQDVVHPTNKINTEYVYVSRRATLLPGLKELEKETFSKIFSQYPNILIDDFMYSIGLSKGEVTEILLKTGIKPGTVIDGVDSFAFKILVSSTDFIEAFSRKRLEQKELLNVYFKSLSSDKKTLYLVDIGWKGSIQDNIYDALDNKINIIGYYWGTINALNSDSNKKNGLMFSTERENGEDEIFSYNHIELEKVFAASHGQTLAYQQVKGDIKPILSQKKNDTEIYDYVKIWQDEMDAVFFNVCKLMKNSIYDFESIKEYLVKLYLYHQCVNIPANRKIYMNFRIKAKENFGNISGTTLKMDKNNMNDIRQKKRFLYVDYSYRVLDKFKLGIFEPFAAVYTRVVYQIMSLKLL